MGLDRKGTQFRIRVRSPQKFEKDEKGKPKLRTKDPGKKGGLQLIVGRLKGRRLTSTQSLRLSTKDFKRVRNKLVPKTMRGIREARSLKRRTRGPVAKAVKTYF